MAFPWTPSLGAVGYFSKQSLELASTPSPPPRARREVQRLEVLARVDCSREHEYALLTPITATWPGRLLLHLDSLCGAGQSFLLRGTRQCDTIMLSIQGNKVVSGQRKTEVCLLCFVQHENDNTLFMPQIVYTSAIFWCQCFEGGCDTTNSHPAANFPHDSWVMAGLSRILAD